MTDQGQQHRGAGPDRGRPLDRSGSRVSARPHAPYADEPADPAAFGDEPEFGQPGEDDRRGRPNPALRIAALATALGVLLISGAASLQVYFRQQRELAELRTSIVERRESIDELEQQINRWDDPAYVEQQARERYGWVMPGETAYRVIGPDGKPIEGAALDSTRPDQKTPADDAWWLQLWSTTRTADRPLPADTPVGSPAPVVEPTPTPSPTG